MKKSRLLFVSAYPEPAALSRFVSGDLALHLRESGWNCVLTSRSPSRLGRVLRIGWDTWRLRGEYDVGCVDVFSGAAFFWAELACWILRRLRRPRVLTLHGGSLPAFAMAHPSRVRRLLADATLVTAPSGYLATEMTPYCDVIHTVPNPIDIGMYPHRTRIGPLTKVVWLRAFHSIYNPALAVECVSMLRQRGVHLTLDMFGPDKKDGSRQLVEAAIQKHGVSDAVTLHGMVPKDRVGETLSRFDIFLNTTDFDNTPVSVLEAMACGLPVISTRVGGIPYLLQDGLNAILVPPRDPVAMSSALERLASDGNLAGEYSRNGRALVEGFDWGLVLKTWEQLLGSVGRAG